MSQLKLKDIKLEEKRAYYRNYYHQHKKLKGRENKTVVCAICGKNFETNTNKKYCSDECKKQARKNILKKYDNNHQEQRKKYWQKYKEENGDLIRAKHRKRYRENNGKEKFAIYREKNKEAINQRLREWRKANPDKVQAIRERYKNNNLETVRANARNNRKKYSQDITKRLKFNISRAFNRYFLKTKTTKEYLQYFNYTVEDLKLHIEKQFKKDMSWDNYGKVWHIDHIRPQSWFDFNNTEEIKKCWSLDNLQPLYAKENFSKGNRYEG